MHITCTGLNHHTTRLYLRERMAFTGEQACTVLEPLAEGGSPFQEAILLSTCNRTELYAVSSQPAGRILGEFLASARKVPFEELSSHLYSYEDEAAVEHLFRVAAGLDSLVLGEPQILGQVGRALDLAREGGMAGALLTRLFQTAIHAGKRARAETAIGRNPASIASLAAGLCGRAHPNLKEARIVIVGAGEMAELAVEALRKRGAGRIRVVNHRLERAQALAEKWQAEADSIDHLEEALIQADVVISSTAAPHPVITLAMVRNAARIREHRSLVLIDIALPRDIEPDAGALTGVRLYDLDDLREHLENSLAVRRSEIPRVQNILSEEQAGFMEFFHAQEVLPVISELHQWADSIRQGELEKTLRKLPDLSDSERARIEAMTEALVRKLLDRPTRNLRSSAACADARDHVHAVRSLFGLAGSTGQD